MEIKKTCFAPSFGIKFVNNEAMRKVIDFSVRTNCENTLDGALHTIAKFKGDKPIMLSIGSNNGVSYANLTYGKRAIPIHFGTTKDPVEAALNGIIEFSISPRSQRSLLGVDKVRSNLTAEGMKKSYLV